MLDCKAIQIQGEECLQLAGNLTIYTAAQARREIPAKLEKLGARILDLGRIEELDTAGVQLLLWLKREASARGTALTIIHPSSVVVETLDLLRLSAMVCDADFVPSSS